PTRRASRAADGMRSSSLFLHDGLSERRRDASGVVPGGAAAHQSNAENATRQRPEPRANLDVLALEQPTTYRGIVDPIGNTDRVGAPEPVGSRRQQRQAELGQSRDKPKVDLLVPGPSGLEALLFHLGKRL